MQRSVLLLIAFFIFYFVAPVVGADDDLDPDTYKNVTQLITARGYPCEQYYATTEDGFILSIQRIPYGISGPSNSTQVKPVVYLMHGFLDASTTWVINGEIESLGFIMADAGFDVWMGNSRGNYYSRGNLYYTVDQPQLWEFSYDEMAQYDLPAIYDLVLSETGVDQLIHVGHSQGTAQAFAAYSTYPEIASKVKLFIALAPIVYLTNQDSLLLSTFAKLPDNVVYDILGDKAFPPDTNWFNTLETYFPDICVDYPWACESVIFLIGGCNAIRTCDPGNMNQSRIEVYSAHIGGASVQDLVHFLQATRSTTFPMYDYDSSSANMQHYNSPTPPNYDVTKMTVPTAIFYGGRDGFADPTDVERLMPQLQNLVFTHYEPSYEHLDFVWGMDAYQKIYNLVIDLVNKYW